MRPVAATVATRSHLARAHCLATSFLDHHPDGEVIVLLVDDHEPRGVFDDLAVTTITTADLAMPKLKAMRARYTSAELSNACKPFLLAHLLDDRGVDRALYLDSDLYIVDTLVPVAFDVLKQTAVLLTPHLRTLPGRGADLVARDLALLLRGTLNAGFVGVRASPDAAGFLEWWGDRVAAAGYQRLERAMNCDQRWLDLVPALDLDVVISKDPGMNVAYWNLCERTISSRDGKWFSNDQPLRFVHFSKFDVDDTRALTRSWSQFDLVNRPDIADVATAYRAALRSSMRIVAEATALPRTRPTVGSGPIGAGEPAPTPRRAPASPGSLASEPDVSVVIPVYNGALLLAAAVNSALTLDGVDIEVIVVDDGSTDDPASVLPSDPRVGLLTADHRGVSHTRNLGLAASRGRMVIFLDADDIITDPLRARDQLALLDRHPEVAIVHSGWEVGDERGDPVATREPWTRLPTIDLEHWVAYPAMMLGAMAFRRASVEAVGGFDPGLRQAQDLELVTRLLLRGWEARWLERVTALYRRHGGNATRDVDAQADALALVLDRLFADPDVPACVTAQQRNVRYSTHVWLASRYQLAERSAAMAAQLAASSVWADLPIGQLPLDWMQRFADARIDAGNPPLDVVGLTADPAWQALTKAPVGTLLEWGVAAAGVTVTTIPSAPAPAPGRVSDIWSNAAVVSNLPNAAIDLSGALARSYGRHRSGWRAALDALAPLHVDGGVHVDGFVEHTFHAPDQQPHTSPWIGFLHNPAELPAWYPIDQSARRLLGDDRFRASLTSCQGLFTLSTSLRDWWAARVDVPVEAVPFPTAPPLMHFSMQGFTQNPFPRVVQVGTWLRKLHAVHLLPVRWLQRTVVHQHEPYIDELFAAERRALHLQVDDIAVETLPFLDNTAYDELLSCNLVFAELYGASANNAVIECLVRGTPILVNPLPAVREYLGDDYPLYFSSRTEAARKAEDPALVSAAHTHLVSRPQASLLTGASFAAAVAASGIYRGLSA